ncbi:MAG: energy transducer TonB [Saprospiraceae bacterium]|nr:energy transducer TonB [Saprospiraceae bacterium]
MRYALLIILFFIAVSEVPAQVQPNVDEMPYFPGCTDATKGSEEKRDCSNQNLIAFISNNLAYPDSALQAGIEGTVYIGFTINEKGEVVNPSLLKDLGYGCGFEAIRIVEEMPDWEPAMKNGKPVSVDMSLPIRFSLQATDGADLTIFWAGLNGNQTSRKQLVAAKSSPIVVRDREGNTLEVEELWIAYRRSFWKKVAHSRGTLTPKMKRILWWSRPGGELTLVASVQQNGKFYEVNKVLTVSE